MAAAAHYGPLPAPAGLVVPVVRGTVAGRCVLERRAIHVADLQAETELFPTGGSLPDQPGGNGRAPITSSDRPGGLRRACAIDLVASSL